MKLSVGTFNVDRAGASKLHGTLQFLRDFQVQAVSEVDVTDHKVPRYVTAWKDAGGYQIVLSQSEHCTCKQRVALATSLPPRPLGFFVVTQHVLA